jgi:hypothetical protein
VLVLRIEALLLILLALFLAVSALLKPVTAPGALAGEITFALLGALTLYFASAAFARRSGAGRAPALLINLIGCGLSYFMLSGHLIWLGVPLALLCALTAIVALLGFAPEIEA